MFFIFLNILIVQSPEIKWGRIYGGDNDDYVRAVIECSDKGFITVGSTNSYGSGGYDVYVFKVDSLGFPVWSKTYGGTGDDYGYAFCPAIDDGYIITGSTNSYGQGRQDIFLIRINENGDSIWTKTYGDSLDEIGYSITPTGNGTYVICGMTNSIGYGGLDLSVIKIDSTGGVIWSKNYGGIFDDCGYCINATNDGGFIITGTTYSLGNGGSDVYLLKIDSLGNEEWSTTYGSNYEEKGGSVQQTADSGYIVCGTAYFVLLGYDWCLLRYDQRGNLIWHTFQGSLNDDFAYSVQEIEEKNYIVGGNFSYELYVIRADTSGLNIWMLIYGGSGTDCAYSVKKTSDNGYIIAGITNSYGAGDNNAYLVKTYADPVGVKESLNRNVSNRIEIESFPSPFREKLCIKFSSLEDSIVSDIKIYDISGQLIKKLGPIRSGISNFVWDGTDENGTKVPTGIYIIYTENSKDRLTKIVIKL